MISDELANWPLPIGTDTELAQTCSIDQLIAALASDATLLSYDPGTSAGPTDIVHHAAATAARVLSKIGASEAMRVMPALIDAYARRDREARHDIGSTIVDLLRFVDDPAPLAAHPDRRVRHEVVSLASIDLLLAIAANNPDAETRLLAVLRLGKLDDDRVLPALQKARADDHRDVRDAAGHMLVERGPIEDKLRVLHEALANSHPAQWTFEAVAKLGARAAFCTNQLAQHVMRSDQPHVLAALAAVAPHARDQTQARRALASIFWRKEHALFRVAGDALAQLRPSTDPATSERVIAALPDLGGGILDATYAIDEPMIVPALVALLSHGDVATRVGAAVALGERGTPAVIPALRAMMQLPDQGERGEAYSAANAAIEKLQRR